jgi:hypothetical protein
VERPYLQKRLDQLDLLTQKRFRETFLANSRSQKILRRLTATVTPLDCTSLSGILGELQLSEKLLDEEL